MLGHSEIDTSIGPDGMEAPYEAQKKKHDMRNPVWYCSILARPMSLLGWVSDFNIKLIDWPGLILFKNIYFFLICWQKQGF